MGVPMVGAAVDSNTGVATVTSLRGHIKTVSCVDVMPEAPETSGDKQAEECDLVLSGSFDQTLRVWTVKRQRGECSCCCCCLRCCRCCSLCLHSHTLSSFLSRSVCVCVADCTTRKLAGVDGNKGKYNSEKHYIDNRICEDSRNLLLTSPATTTPALPFDCRSFFPHLLH